MAELTKLLAQDLDVLEKNSHLRDIALVPGLLDLGAWFQDLKRICEARGLAALHRNRPNFDRYFSGPLANLAEELTFEQLSVILCEIADRGITDHLPTVEGRDNANFERARIVIGKILKLAK